MTMKDFLKAVCFLGIWYWCLTFVLRNLKDHPLFLFDDLGLWLVFFCAFYYIFESKK